jgi:prephenate dehydratase
LPSVAYQGEPGAYSEEAALGYFGAGLIAPMPLPTFSAVVNAVVSGEAAAAFLPLENSVAGTVGEAVDALLRTHLPVIGEAVLPVRHQLLGLPAASFAGIRCVASHRQALAQCERYLASHDWQVIVADDTAGAARALAASHDASRAVVASAGAAARYGLTVLDADIQDDEANMTRFAVVARPDASLPEASGPLAPAADAARSTLLVFETLHRPGALHHALGALAEAGVNLSRIESRPTGRAQWQYRFLVSVDGDAAASPLREALPELQTRTHGLAVLGSFPTAAKD